MLQRCVSSRVARLRSEAERLAGRNSDFAQRAIVYHHLTRHSGGNHIFPLLAAHGALWGAGYFKRGLQAGRFLRWRFPGSSRHEAYAALSAFAEAFRDINRRVCIETYFSYMLTADPSLRPAAGEHLPERLLNALVRCHSARRLGQLLTDRERRDLFGAFFEWEQEAVVQPAVSEAFAAFDWAEIAWAARRPAIRFSYLRATEALRFANFGCPQERLAKGYEAFDRGQRRGWSQVEQGLLRYEGLPRGFRPDCSAHFHALRRASLNWIDGRQQMLAVQVA